MTIRMKSACLSLLLWIKCAISQEEVNQNPLNLHVSDGEEARITCQYTISRFYSLQWYRQLPPAGPEHIITFAWGGSNTKDDIHFTLKKSEQLSEMTIVNSRIQNSAMYFCSVETNCVFVYDLFNKNLLLPRLNG
uniref:Ig-like domain-containing protein n=1 Tax=Erpetoichthys calabaricus TaxID=27687 RepID=A0A8C4X6B5_ERPCA